MCLLSKAITLVTSIESWNLKSILTFKEDSLNTLFVPSQTGVGTSL